MIAVRDAIDGLVIALIVLGLDDVSAFGIREEKPSVFLAKAELVVMPSHPGP